MNPVEYSDLMRSSGRPWAFRAGPAGKVGAPVHVWSSWFAHRPGAAEPNKQTVVNRLTAELRPVDADPAPLVREALERTFATVCIVPRPGVLTPHEKRAPHQIDYIACGPDLLGVWVNHRRERVARIWALVHLLPRGGGWPTRGDGTCRMLMTVTPRSRLRESVLAGAPVDAANRTVVLKPGERLDENVHCAWVRPGCGRARGTRGSAAGGCPGPGEPS